MTAAEVASAMRRSRRAPNARPVYGRRSFSPARSTLAVHRVVDDSAGQVSGEHLDEVVGIAAQVAVFADTDAGRARFEQVAGIDGANVRIPLRIVGHHRHDADTQAEFH